MTGSTMEGRVRHRPLREAPPRRTCDHGPVTSHVRPGDRDRDEALESLNRAYAEGRLGVDEHSERVDAVYRAASLLELSELTSDLVARERKAPASPRPRRWSVAVLADAASRVSGDIDEVVGGVAVIGDVVLDLRDRLLPGDELHVRAVTLIGDVVVVVPPGTSVTVSGILVLGERLVDVPEDDIPAARVHVTASGLLGDVVVRTAPPQLELT